MNEVGGSRHIDHVYILYYHKSTKVPNNRSHPNRSRTHLQPDPQSPLPMCVENHYRFRRCGHTRFLRWDYCSVIVPKDRLPETGYACRRYKMKYKDNQEISNCFHCMREKIAVQPLQEEPDLTQDRESSKEVSGDDNGDKRKSKTKDWFKRFLVGGFDENRL
jgi:hypothetical protein